MNRFWATSAVLFCIGCFGSGDQSDDPNPTDGEPVEVGEGEDSAATADGTQPVADDGSADSGSDGATPASEPESEAARRLRDLGNSDREVLASAADYFETTYEDRGVSIFLEHAGHANPEVRRGAVYGLFTHFDPGDEQTLAAIHRALDDKDALVRRVALKTMALREFPREDFLSSIPRIAKHLDDEYEPDAATRAHVARMLKRYSTLSQPALPKLDDAMRNDPDFLVRSACLAALYDIAQNAEEALPGPTYLLRNDPDPRLRRRAAIQLGKYKAASAPAIDDLVKSLSDDGVPQRAPDDPLVGTDEPVCIAAAETLTRIGDPAVQPLIAATQSQDRNVRLLAIRSLGNMGPIAKAATGRLQAFAQSPDEAEATAAKAALVRINTP